MSQVSIIDIEGNHPTIPTRFDANVGFAIPIANVLEIHSAVVAAGAVPTQTVGSGNTITTNIQISQAVASTNATAIGLSAFNSTDFSVDANGFVSLLGAAAADAFMVDAFTAPGTNPVLPSGLGIITVTGAQVAAGTTTNVIRTNSVAANSYTIEIQRSSAQAASTVGANGVSHFNSTEFTVDGNGFVSLIGGSLAVDSFAMQTGTSPVVPTVAGLVTFNGSAVASGTNPVRTNGTGVNTMQLEVQRTQAIASTNASNVGLAAFDSARFTVDGNGFVSLNGAGVGETITGDTGGALSPTAGNWNILGLSPVAGTNPVRATGAGSTLTVNVQKSQAIASTNATNVGLAAFNSARFTVDANGFVSTSGTGVLNTLSDDVGTAILPAAGNIQLVGHINEQGATKFSTVVAGTNLANINPMSSARWIVDPLGFNGTHTTLTTAMASATSGDTIHILAGSTLTENVTLKAGVNVSALNGDQMTPNVTIIGNLTASFAGTATISNIRIQTNSAACITVSGSSATILNINNCYINASNNTAISLTSSSSSAAIKFVNCMGDLATTGIAVYASSSVGQLSFLNSNFTNTGASTTANTVSAGSVIAFTSSFANPTTSSGTAIVALEVCDLSTSAQNVTAFTNGGSGNATAFLCRFQSGTATAIVTTSLLTIATCAIGSSNAAVISGAGSIEFSNLAFGNSRIITVTTQTGGVGSGLSNISPSAGYIGERLTSTVTALGPTTTTPTGIITLALTPGVWDISAIGSFSYSGISSASIINISSVNNTLTGTLGDAFAQFNQANTTGFLTTLSVPTFRVAVTAITNYFCVVQANYSTGAVSVNARMSAVRAG